MNDLDTAIRLLKGIAEQAEDETMQTVVSTLALDAAALRKHIDAFYFWK